MMYLSCLGGMRDNDLSSKVPNSIEDVYAEPPSQNITH